MFKQLNAILASETSRSKFREHLRHSHAEEIVDLWEEITKFIDCESTCESAERIYQTFIDAEAPKRVNIDPEQGLQLKNFLVLNNPKKENIDSCLKSILGQLEVLMAQNYLLSFQKNK